MEEQTSFAIIVVVVAAGAACKLHSKISKFNCFLCLSLS